MSLTYNIRGIENSQTTAFNYFNFLTTYSPRQEVLIKQLISHRGTQKQLRLSTIQQKLMSDDDFE